MEIMIGTSIIIFCTFTSIMFCIIMDKLIEIIRYVDEIKESIEDFDILVKNVSESKENESIRS